MKFDILVIIIALFILVITLIIVFFNLPKYNPPFPRALTNCPDYWQVNPTTGNCIIPSEDIKNANIGNLRNKGTPIYIYNFGKDAMSLSALPEYAESDGKTSKTIKGTPYKEFGTQVYAYNLDPDKNKYNIPVGYYTVSDTSLESKEELFENIMYNGNEINFNDSKWSAYDGGGSSLCNIKDWINKTQISWDGMNTNSKCDNRK
uniref:Uncharacterized protein n=1 Tax=viral metagenome TaxID=1070528 RepID=A0A6C0HZZ9_9ZZZZ